MNSVARTLLLVIFSAGIVEGASPRQQLLGYIPSDTSLCVLLQGLRDHGDDLARSPFMAQFAKSPLGRQLVALAEIQQLQKLEKHLEQFTGLTSRQLREEILGDLVVLAYRSGPPDKPQEEEGLVLIHARGAKLLQTLVDHINKQQTLGGEVKGIEIRTHRGMKYVCRREKDRDTFYYLNDQVLLFTGTEGLLLRALDHESAQKPDALPPLEQALRHLRVEGGLLTFWINPRTFDPHLRAKIAAAPDEEVPFLQTFFTYWKAFDGLALSLALEKELTLNLAISARPEALSTSARRFLTTLAEPSRIWQAIPPDPLFALATRVDLRALLDLWMEFLPAEKRPEILANLERLLGAPLGKNLVREVLPAVGPEFSLIALAPSPEQGMFPSVLLAARVKPTDDPAPVDQALWSAVHSVATILVLTHNQKHPGKPLVLRRTNVDGMDIRSLVGNQALPDGLQPSFALSHGHLLFATSPPALQTLRAWSADDPAPARARMESLPILVVSFKAWHGYLQQRRDGLAGHLATSDRIPLEEARKRLDGMVAVLEYLDRLEVRHKPGGGRLLLQIALKPRWSLR